MGWEGGGANKKKTNGNAHHRTPLMHRLHMPLKFALGVRETVAAHRLGALWNRGGVGTRPWYWLVRVCVVSAEPLKRGGGACPPSNAPLPPTHYCPEATWGGGGWGGLGTGPLAGVGPRVGRPSLARPLTNGACQLSPFGETPPPAQFWGALLTPPPPEVETHEATRLNDLTVRLQGRADHQQHHLGPRG